MRSRVLTRGYLEMCSNWPLSWRERHGSHWFHEASTSAPTDPTSAFPVSSGELSIYPKTGLRLRRRVPSACSQIKHSICSPIGPATYHTNEKKRKKKTCQTRVSASAPASQYPSIAAIFTSGELRHVAYLSSWKMSIWNWNHLLNGARIQPVANMLHEL